MATLKQTNSYFLVSCVIGLLLSWYALIVEVQKEKNADYEAYCDINEHISCTKAFGSEYGKGFGIIGPIFGENSILNQPNSVGGIIFYLCMIFTNFSNEKVLIKFQIFCCIISNFLSIYLAYILYFILHDFCIVCVTTYVVNAVNLALSIAKWNLIKGETLLKRSTLKKE